MGTIPERQVLTSVSSSGGLRYRRKVFAPADNQQLEQQPVDKRQQHQQKHRHPLQSQPHPLRITSTSSQSKGSRSPPTRHFWSNSRQPKQSQPALFKQLLWKVKTVQPTSEVLLQHQRSWNNDEVNEDEDEKDEEVIFSMEQRKVRKMLASEAGTLVGGKSKAVIVAELTSSEIFIVESSSQETQSGSEDETLFIPYSDMRPTMHRHVLKQQDEKAEGTACSSLMVPSKTTEMPTNAQEERAYGKTASTRWKQIHNYKQKKKLRCVAAKEQKRFFCEQKQVHVEQNERLSFNDASAGSTLNSDIVAVDIFHPPLNLATELDADVYRAIISQLEGVVPHIVVGDVACPITTNEQRLVRGGVEGKGQAVDTAVKNFRQHVIDLLEQSPETHLQYRESFVVEDSGFDAASSYDFLKRRYSEILRSCQHCVI